MKYAKIDLMQIERSDVPTLKNFINAFRHHLTEHREVNTELVNERYEALLADTTSYHFAIRGFPEAGFGSTTLGFCAIQDISWGSRNGELVFLMQDESASPATIPDTDGGRIAFGKLLKFAFEEINLHKVYLNVVDGNNVYAALGTFGFVTDGVRREARLKRGTFVDVKVCSLLSQEWQEKNA
jgi:RimJ/RimL family protein N-acetyltransferase